MKETCLRKRLFLLHFLSEFTLFSSSLKSVLSAIKLAGNFKIILQHMRDPSQRQPHDQKKALPQLSVISLWIGREDRPFALFQDCFYILPLRHSS